MTQQAAAVATHGISHVGYRHEAFLWAGKDAFLEGTVPFVADAAATHEPVMVALIRPRLEWVRSALGAAHASRVTFVDMGDVGHNPARIIPAWRRFIEDNGDGARTLRGIGEPVWAGRRPAEVTECQVHEALLNLAIGPQTPLWLRCPYEADALDADVVDEALRSHPHVVSAGEAHDSTSFGGLAHIRDAFELPLAQPAAVSDDLEFTVTDLSALRSRVHRRAVAILDPERAEDLVLAVHEVAANSVDHAGGTGRLRIWREPGAFVCEIRDRGRIQDALVGRRTPTVDQPRGRGLWLANQLCDLVQIRSAADGTIVRISSWL